jgi:hypothetical protein
VIFCYQSPLFAITMVTNIRHLHPFYSNSLRACSANNGVLITFHSTTSFTTTFRKEGYSAAITSSNILYCPLSTYLSISLSTRMLGIIPMLSSLGLRAPSLSHNPNPILFFFWLWEGGKVLEFELRDYAH